MPSTKTRVAVIGGGVAGLVVARHITDKPENYQVVVFEQTEHVGGTWVYTDATDVDKNGLPVHSSMYKNLRTNLPKEIMQIPDFPFQDEDGPSFVHHTVIRQYLQDYAQHFNLYPYIEKLWHWLYIDCDTWKLIKKQTGLKFINAVYSIGSYVCAMKFMPPDELMLHEFNTLVKHIEPEKSPGGQVLYSVTYENVIKNEEKTKNFDVVVMCNGHYTVGEVPRIKGADTFPGGCIHSHQYRMPEKYAGKKVCILGASWSGIDIAIEVARHSPKVYLSHNLEKLEAVLPDNVEQRPGIESIDGNTFVFRDGSTANVDDFIYCTGYKFTYPFLSDKIELNTNDNHVEPIYKHFIHTDMPNLFFMGLPGIVIPFPMFHIQAQYILKLLEGQLKLPSSEEMRMDMMREKQMLLNQGIPLRHIIKMKDRQWAYYDELAATANVPSFPPVIRKIWEHVNEMRETDFTTYKNYQYRIIDKENFKVSYSKLC